MKRLFNRTVVLMAVLFIGLSNAFAVIPTTDASQVALLTQQLENMRKMLQTTKKQLEEMKATSDAVMQTNDVIHQIYKEYNALVNLDLAAELDAIKSSASALTNLDELAKAETLEDKYLLLHDEIGLRFKRSDKETINGKDIDAVLKRLEEVEAELTATQKRLADTSKRHDSQLQTEISQSTASIAAVMLEQRKIQLKQELEKQSEQARQLNWDKGFIGYLQGTDRNNAGAIEDNFLTNFIQNVISPKHIYEPMTYVTGISTLFVYLLVGFLGLRFFQESVRSVYGNATMGEAIQATSAVVPVYVIYVSSGFLLFMAMFAIFDIYGVSGSQQYIHNGLLSLRDQMLEEKVYKSWLGEAFATTVDLVNVVSASATWAIYQIVSLLYVLLVQVINLLFALALAFLYVFGFIAIATMVLKGRFNIVKTWMVSIYGLFMWGMSEIILMAILGGFHYVVSNWMIDNVATGTGPGYVAITYWHLYCVVMMAFIVLVKIISAWIGYYMSQNQSIIASFAGAATALTYFTSSKMLPNYSQINQGGNGGLTTLLGSSLPSAGGDRSRDRMFGGMASSLKNVASAPLSDVARAGGRSLSKGYDWAKNYSTHQGATNQSGSKPF